MPGWSRCSRFQMLKTNVLMLKTNVLGGETETASAARGTKIPSNASDLKKQQSSRLPIARRRSCFILSVKVCR